MLFVRNSANHYGSRGKHDSGLACVTYTPK